MMKRLVITLFILFSIQLSSQTFGQGAKTTLKIGGSAISYKGDLSPTFSDWQGAARAELNFNAHKDLNWGINLWYGQIAAGTSDALTGDVRPEMRFTNVRTTLLSTELFLGYQKFITKSLKAYARVGVGGMKYDPIGDIYRELGDGRILRDRNIKLRDVEVTRTENEEEYGRYAFTLPLGIGLSYTLPNGFGIDTQFRYINPFTDYLDNVSELGSVDGNDKLIEWNIALVIPLKYLSKTENTKYKQKLRKETLIRRR
ncbi:outer membrane beta-barrel protein [Sediminitomix flava]|uniref:Outer membrane protein with beta-barrel domain n=1 Tax=Sediminitomix flava TaxID=379075 RepID=A0A315ZJC4_SEDFL|nr:outer membrane beta-barrel protein [Sediminitomix flava]PWJ44794.1 outer membrane protein with beta-barrel domain [Sediminitomix flava]